MERHEETQEHLINMTLQDKLILDEGAVILSIEYIEGRGENRAVIFNVETWPMVKAVMTEEAYENTEFTSNNE